MSQNNTIRKSDKKFIRTEKARIRAQFLDFKKQEELISEIYKKFLEKPVIKEKKEVDVKNGKAGKNNPKIKKEALKSKQKKNENKTDKT